MSRVGKKPIVVPAGVTVNVQEHTLTVKGPKGELSCTLPASLAAQLDGNTLTIKRLDETPAGALLHGTFRSHAANMLAGVSKGYEKLLVIEGVGFRAAVQGSTLTLTVGRSHPNVFAIPAGLKITVEANTKVTLQSADKEIVGSAAAKIRGFFPPEPYKGKGIRYSTEHVRRKAGKTVAAKA